MHNRLKQWILRRRRTATFGGILVLLLLLVPWTLLRTPGWYAPPEIAPHNRQRVRNNLVAAEQAFTETLRTETLRADPRAFRYRLYQEDLNQWLAMRREIYPLVDEQMPVNVTDPFVVFEDNRITLAIRYAMGVTDVVLSMDLDVAFEDEGMQLQASRLRCGSLPVPLSFAGLGLDEPIRVERGDAWPGSPLIQGDLGEGLRIDAHARWANGGLNYRVIDAAVEPGVLTFTVEAVRKSDQRAWNDQS